MLLGTSVVYALGAVLEAASAIPSPCPSATVVGAPPCPLGLGVVPMLVGRVVTGVPYPYP